MNRPATIGRLIPRSCISSKSIFAQSCTQNASDLLFRQAEARSAQVGADRAFSLCPAGIVLQLGQAAVEPLRHLVIHILRRSPPPAAHLFHAEVQQDFIENDDLPQCQ